MIILLVIAAIAVSLPMAGIVVVSLASRREDAAQSLSSRPSGAIQIAARRVVGFHGAGLARRPARRGGSRPVRDAAGPMTRTSPACWPASGPRTGGSRPSPAAGPGRSRAVRDGRPAARSDPGQHVCTVTAAPAGAAVTA